MLNWNSSDRKWLIRLKQVLLGKRLLRNDHPGESDVRSPIMTAWTVFLWSLRGSFLGAVVRPCFFLRLLSVLQLVHFFYCSHILGPPTFGWDVNCWLWHLTFDEWDCFGNCVSAQREREKTHSCTVHDGWQFMQNVVRSRSNVKSESKTPTDEENEDSETVVLLLSVVYSSSSGPWLLAPFKTWHTNMHSNKENSLTNW